MRRRRNNLTDELENTCPVADAHQAVPCKRIYQYSVADKLGILKEVSNGLSQFEAIRKYHIKNRTFFRDWSRLLDKPVSNSTDLVELKRLKTSHAGPHPMYPDISALIECTIESFTSILQPSN